MWALITGSSSGIGRDMSRYLYSLGYNLVIVARDENKLNELKINLEKDNRRETKETNKQKQEIIVISKDLSNKENCLELYEKTKNLIVSVWM